MPKLEGLFSGWDQTPIRQWRSIRTNSLGHETKTNTSESKSFKLFDQNSL